MRIWEGLVTPGNNHDNRGLWQIIAKGTKYLV